MDIVHRLPYELQKKVEEEYIKLLKKAHKHRFEEVSDELIYAFDHLEWYYSKKTGINKILLKHLKTIKKRDLKITNHFYF
jgi:hypothetical protein